MANRLAKGVSAALTAAIIAILAVLAPLAAPAVAWAADTPPAPKEYASEGVTEIYGRCWVSSGHVFDVLSYTEYSGYRGMYAADKDTSAIYSCSKFDYDGARELPNLKVPDGFDLSRVQELENGDKLAVIAVSSDVYNVQIYDVGSHRVTASGEFRQFTPLYVAPDLKTVWGASDDDSNGSGHVIRARSISGGSVVDKSTDLDVQPYWTFDNGSTVLYDEKTGHYYRIDVGKDGKNVDDPTPLSDHAYRVLGKSSDRTIYTFIEDPKSSSDTNDLPNDPSRLDVVTKNLKTGKVLWSMKATSSMLNTIVTSDGMPTGALSIDGRYLYAYAQTHGAPTGTSKSLVVFDTRTGASADAGAMYDDDYSATPGLPLALSTNGGFVTARYRVERGGGDLVEYSTGYEPETEEHWGQGGLPIPVVIGIGVACALIIVMLATRSITRTRKLRFAEAVAQAVEKATAESSAKLAELEFQLLLSKSKKLPRIHLGAVASHDSTVSRRAAVTSGSIAAATSAATRMPRSAAQNVAVPPLMSQSAPVPASVPQAPLPTLPSPVPKPVRSGATVPSAAAQAASGRTSSQRFCAQCGARLGDDATRFCPNCGARL